MAASKAKLGLPKKLANCRGNPSTPAAAMSVFAVIKMTGRITGRMDSTRPGNSDSSWRAIASSCSTVTPGASRKGMCSRRSRQNEKASPASAIGKLTAMPIKIITPMSTWRNSAIASGPGVGGTSACVEVAPAAIAIR